VDLPLYWKTMPRGLVAAIVTLLLGITPGLALACDARCLDEHVARTSADSLAGHGHARHRSNQPHAAAHAGHAHTARSTDAASPVRVTTLVTGADAAHHGCKAAFDEATVDRQFLTASLGPAPDRPVMASPPPATAALPRHARHAPAASDSGRASIPLRI
jgi:hypothetical protein